VENVRKYDKGLGIKRLGPYLNPIRNISAELSQADDKCVALSLVLFIYSSSSSIVSLPPSSFI
jgi:hypothetical protein